MLPHNVTPAVSVKKCDGYLTPAVSEVPKVGEVHKRQRHPKKIWSLAYHHCHIVALHFDSSGWYLWQLSVAGAEL